MKKFAVLVILLGVFASYQNCAPTGGNFHNSPAELTTQIPSSYQQIPAQSFHTLSVWDSAHEQFLDVDLTSGVVSIFSEGGQTANGSFNLTAQQLADVQGILSTANICVPVVDPQQLANQVCAQNYIYPYANLSQYHLGEKVDSCSVPTDLCGNAASQLQAWSAQLVLSH